MFMMKTVNCRRTFAGTKAIFTLEHLAVDEFCLVHEHLEDEWKARQ